MRRSMLFSGSDGVGGCGACHGRRRGPHPVEPENNMLRCRTVWRNGERRGYVGCVVVLGRDFAAVGLVAVS